MEGIRVFTAKVKFLFSLQWKSLTFFAVMEDLCFFTAMEELYFFHSDGKVFFLVKGFLLHCAGKAFFTVMGKFCFFIGTVSFFRNARNLFLQHCSISFALQYKFFASMQGALFHSDGKIYFFSSQGLHFLGTNLFLHCDRTFL